MQSVHDLAACMLQAAYCEAHLIASTQLIPGVHRVTYCTAMSNVRRRSTSIRAAPSSHSKQNGVAQQDPEGHPAYMG